ncbi:GTP cyclohydrolase, FolE2/MptA family [Thermodesulfobacteriota bacterium]
MNLISEAEHRRVLEAGDDVPEQRPSFALPLNAVGIAGKTVWVLLPQGLLPFTAQLEVDLAGERRGIHMSRLEEVITNLHQQPFADLRAYGLALGREMVARQNADSGSLTLHGLIPQLRKGLISGRASLDTVKISVKSRFWQEVGQLRDETMLGVEVCHITACPCTQVYNRELFHRHDDPCPMPTHSQRSSTRLEVQADDSAPGYDELLACLEEALHVTQDLLKRPDEAEIVLKSHRLPQFAEDAVRETARVVGIHLGSKLPLSSRVRIESLSLESIHIHNVTCRLECTLGEIMTQLTIESHAQS